MIFFLKRMWKRFPVFILLLAAPVVAVWISGTQTPPPAGFYMPDADPVSARITGYLLENGFVEYEDPVLLREQVCAGKLDCGAVFPEGLKNKVAAGELEGCIVFYTAPASYIPQLYKNHIAAAMYREYAPYITAAAFKETAVNLEQVLAEYEAMFAGGYVFSFDVTTLSQQNKPDLPKGRNAGIGATAILMMISMLILTGETVERSFGTMLPRLGLQVTVSAAAEMINTPSVFTVFPEGQMVLRFRQSGDALRLSGGRKSLKKILIDRKIPAAQRQNLPVITDSRGILAVYSIGVDLDRAAKELPAVQIEIKPLEERE